MASLDQISPEIILKIAGVIGQKLKALGEFSRESYGGVRAVAEMLNRLDSTSSKRDPGAASSSRTPNLAETIRHLMFVFEDLLLIDPLGLKEVLAKVDRKVLTIALKGTSEQLRNQILGCLSQRGAEMLREDMEALGPIKIKEVESGAAADHRGGAAAGVGGRGQPEGRGRRAVCRLGSCSRTTRGRDRASDLAPGAVRRPSRGAPQAARNTPNARLAVCRRSRSAQCEQRVSEARRGRTAGGRGGRTKPRGGGSAARVERLARTIDELAGLRPRLRREAEADMVKLALAIARRVLRRESRWTRRPCGTGHGGARKTAESRRSAGCGCIRRRRG